MTQQLDSPVREPFGRRFFGSPHVDATLIAALVVIAVVALWIAVPGLFSSYDPLVGIPGDAFVPPGAEHWFGTDRIGRDLYSRVVHGTRLTIYGAFVAVVIGLIVGSILGLIAALARGAIESAIMRVVDVLLAVPGFLLALIVVTALGPGTVQIAFGVGIAAIAPFARLIRSEALRVTELQYVHAARISGTRAPAVLFRHVLPNSIGPVLALVAVELGSTVLSIAALGFLGYGAPPPTPEWGTLIAEGRSFLANAWWLTTLPGVVVVVAVLAFARISHWIQALYRI
ncbi:ABC transporter permease [Rhodococcoides yunnanense]|uniref:ABC transporter permease n=1 Tax=Rhodococcoides yunnanense TaxID=278209 RepID=UPI0009FD2CB5|nr:ABC transporter permease [Rhodococcus yunnanensis]